MIHKGYNTEGYANNIQGYYGPNYQYYRKDHLGNNREVWRATTNQTIQKTQFYPSGIPWVKNRGDDIELPINANTRKYNDKEFVEMHGLDEYDYGARHRLGAIPVFPTVDPLAEKYPWCSPYVYCNNNPIKYIDPTGLAWRPTSNQNTGVQTGYEWVPEDQSYDKNGSLKTGLYAQAIFFSENGTYDSNSDYNMGSSTAYVYLADGTTTTFDASTHPSDQDNYATVPGGLYEAKVGQHKGNYTALRMGDVGTTNFDNNRIELGTENPAFDDGRTYATGINIHKPGIGNKTGMTTSGSPISAGCSLIWQVLSFLLL